MDLEPHVIEILRLAAMVEESNDAIVGTTMEGTITHWNRAAAQLFGYTRDEAIGKSVGMLLPMERQTTVPTYIHRMSLGDVIRNEKGVSVRKDGSLFDYAITLSYLRDGGGEPNGFVAIVRDVTGSNLTDAQARLVTERLSLAAESAHLGIWDIDLEKNSLNWDKRMYEIFGIRPEEFGGAIEDWEKTLHPDDKPVEISKFQDALAGNGDYHSEFRIVRPDGQVRRIEAHSIVQRGPDGRPRRMIGVNRDVTERKTVELEMELLQTAIAQTGESLFITDVKGNIQFVNPAFEASTGYSRREVLGKNPRILKSGRHEDAFYLELWRTIASGRIWKGRLVNKCKDGSLLTEDATISPVLGTNGTITHYVAVKRDASEQIRLEAELRQSQKMESVGRLAGGVAHDFNNILTAINGYVGFALSGLAEGDQRRDDLNEVLLASGRATRLTRQLLAFSRKQILNPEVLDINAAVGESVNMLKRLIGEDIKFKTQLAAQPCLCKVDAGQIEQVFLNLAVNARDAMPKGGTLTIETEIVPTTATFTARHPGISHRTLVCVTVRDTGCGMNDEVKAHVFEPFFTTKEIGKGTGLGLSMVYGIIKQSGGDIEVESAPSRGTTFRIYFPQVIMEHSKKDKDKDKDKDVVSGGNETVLFVEDEDGLRRLGVRAMKAAGYEVLSAADGREALAVIERQGRAVDLLVTDVVMPGMSGRQLAQAIASKKMVRRTLFISGFTDDAIVQHGVLEPGLAFMYKPFSPDVLLRKMREILDGPADKARA